MDVLLEVVLELEEAAEDDDIFQMHQQKMKTVP
jgi:hypothetical protein